MSTKPFIQHMLDFNAIASVSYDEAASKVLQKNYWRVREAFLCTFQYRGMDASVTIPEGYLTDGASVPRYLWWLIPPWGSYGQAAIVHDFLCEHLTIERNAHRAAISRQDADRILNCAMKDLKVPVWKRWIIYTGVYLWAKLMRIHEPEIDMSKATYYANHPKMESDISQ